jgi:hypothetical protein
MQDIKEAYYKPCNLMKGDPKKRPFIHKKKKGDKQEDVKYEFKCYLFHVFFLRF